MSRRGKSPTVGSVGGKDGRPPESHQAEYHAGYRQFLIRSLERNDTDLAAVIELNRSLHRVKRAIVETCGEMVLLKLGQGHLKLAPVGDALVAACDGDDADLPEGDGADLCVDFLLRMKLRRKLLNRLSRRLNRIAHALDGEDVAAPGPPKYGDLRLHVDPEAVDAFAAHWERKDGARKRIESQRERNLLREAQDFEARAKRAAALLEEEEEEEEGSGKNAATDEESSSDGAEDRKGDDKGVGSKGSSDAMSLNPGGEGTSGKEGATASGEEEQEPTEASAAAETTRDPPDRKIVAEGSGAQEVEGKGPEDNTGTTAPSSSGEGTTINETQNSKESPAVDDETTTPAERQGESSTGSLPFAKAPLAGEEAKSHETTADGEPPETTKSTLPADTATSAAKVGSGDDDAVADADDPLRSSVVDGLEADYAILREYNEPYEKILDPNTGEVRYPILEREREEDHSAIKFGAGIGATHRSMTAKDREVEFNRWQTSVLSRIPEQPTFAELGLENRVFLLEERKKRILENAEAEFTEKKKHKSEDNEDKEDRGDAKVDEEETDEEGDAKTNGASAAGVDNKPEATDNAKDEEDPKTTPEDAAKNSEGKTAAAKEDDKKKKDTAADETVKRPAKSISLAPVPSFYEQDIRRIKLVHSDLMATSMHDHARFRLEEVTRGYNSSLKMSNELYDRHERVRHQLNAVLYESRNQSSKQRSNDYHVELAVAKTQWLRRRKVHEEEKLKRVLPSRRGIIPQGSPYLQRALARRDLITNAVATVLSDVVDAVASDAKIEKFNERLVLPPPNNNSNVAGGNVRGQQQQQRQEQMIAALRADAQNLALKLRESEQNRDRAWKKMLKTKAEFDLPMHHIPGGGTRGGPNSGGGGMPVNLDMSNYHRVPAPALRQCQQERIPQEVAARAAVPSYVPAARSPPSILVAAPPQGLPFGGSGAGAGADVESLSKYSAARVKERISADGTVAPVSEPKKTKDGLYQRPAGRTRKGMQWDALRGIWVPSARG